jgi:hypothetical protein
MVEKLVVLVMGQDCEKFIGMCLESVKQADAIVFCEGMEPEKKPPQTKSYKIFRKMYPLGHWIANAYDQDDPKMNGKQRNFYLRYLKENFNDWWCLAIDADEVVEDISNVKEFIQTAESGLWHIRMRHLIGDLAHEDSMQNIHFVLNRLFKISWAKGYPEVEHPILMGLNRGATICTTIWHLSYIPNMWEIKRKYENHLKKSDIHSPEYLHGWYYSHLFGAYPRKEFDPVELPEIILREFKINKDELYFRKRGLELKHFVDALHWKDFFRPRSAIEFGCGRGPRILALDSIGIHTKGIELSSWAVDHPIAKNLNIEVGDVINYKSKASYDLVIAYDLLEHLDKKDLDNAIRNLILMSNKWILVSVPVLGDPNLERDKSHKIKESKEWWINQFEKRHLNLIPTPDHFLFKKQILIFTKHL